jgi:hypothetical protein
MKIIVATLLAMASFCLVGNVSADLSAWQAQAQATSGNVVADTTGWTFDGTAGVSFDYGALDEIDGKPVDGSTIEYIVNITDAATSTALGSMLGWSPGGEINVLKLEQWNDTGKFGITVPGFWDYTLGTDSTFDYDVQVVFRRNNDGGTIDLFVNGAYMETDTNKTNWRQDGGAGTLGMNNVGGDVPTGVIYAVGTYDVALTNQQIYNLFDPPPFPLIPDSFDLYADTSDLSSLWTVSGGVLSLETIQTHDATPKSMKVDYAGPVLITKDISQDFDYSGYDGKNLVLWFLGQASNTPGDLTFSVLDSDDLIIESLTLFSATTRDYWSTTGTLVDTLLQPDWSRVRKIQIEITGSGTMYFDNLSFETNYQAVAGDLNFDNRVNIQDLLLFLEQWLDVNCFGFGCADLDGVGGVDMKDFALLAQNWMMKSSSLVISEFMAVNSYVPFVNPLNISTTVDGVVEHPDWIEIHNSDLDAAVITTGWYLTDDATNLTKWRFPDVTIPAGGYLVVYASRKTQDEHPGNYPYVDDDSHFHTNFKLSNNGEYLEGFDFIWNRQQRRGQLSSKPDRRQR